MGKRPQAEECLMSPKTKRHAGDSSELKKTARRTIFTPQQLYYLEERFVENQFPDADQRERIANHINLTTHHVQVWFQNKRAKARRKLKKIEIEKPKVHVPKPPSFWPQHLPFDSKLTEIRNNSNVTGSDTTGLVSPSKITSFNKVMANVNPSTVNATSSTASSTSVFSQNSTTNLKSSSPVTLSNSSPVQSSLNLSTAQKRSASPHKYPDYPCPSCPHSNSYSYSRRESVPRAEVSPHDSHHGMCIEVNQQPSSFKANPSSYYTKHWHYGTTLSMDMSPLRPPQYQEQLPYYSGSAYNNNAPYLKHCRVDQNHVDNTSLLLLANCATRTTAASQIGMNSGPFINISEKSKSISPTVSVHINTSDSIKTAQLPSLYCNDTAQECETTRASPAIPPSNSLLGCKGGCYPYIQSLNSELQPFSGVMESQTSCLNDPVEGIQTPPCSEGLFPLHEMLNSR